MFKVVLADDEPWVLYGLEHIFSWEKWGFQVEASVQSALEAYEIVCREKTDVVFCDINMPEMDGIAFLEKVRQQRPDVTVVMVSGYSEFDYAKKALHYGAYDYLLKPINEADTDAFLMNLADFLWEKILRESRHILEQMKEGLLPFDIVVPGAADSRLPYRQAVMVKDSLQNAEIDLPADMIYRHLRFGRCESLYLCRCGADLREVLDRQLPPSMTVGVSLPMSEGDGRSLVCQAGMAVQQSFFTGRGGMYSYVPTDVSLVRQAGGEIAVRCGQEAYQELASYLKQIPENAMNVQDVVFLWNQFRLHCRADGAADFEYTDAVQLAEDFKDYISWTDMIAGIDCGLQERAGEMSTGRGVYLQMVEYIHQNYAQPLFLRDLSERFALNFTYCSELFRKYSETTFSRYLTGYRLERAAQLLTETGMSVETVCFRCGYNEYSYFNRVFKKKYGMTPFQYRNKAKRDDEKVFQA